MDAPKKFSIRSFLDRMKVPQQQRHISGTAACSTSVIKRNMVVFDFPKNTFDTLKDFAFC